MAAHQSMHQPYGVAPSTPPVQPATPHRSSLESVRELLDAGRIDKALHLARKNEGDRELKNAVGVCHMRLGHPEKSISVYRSMTLAPGGVVFKADVPDKHKVNFATALLLAGNVSGCTSILNELSDRNYTGAQQLRSAIDHWKKSLSFWQRINLALGGQPHRVVELRFPPGEV